MQKLLILLIAITISNVLFGQGYHGGGHINPNDLDTITVSGTVIVDETITTHPIYYLDENNDGLADYHLNFGPYWYEPDSSSAVRPANGANITITGGLHDSFNMDQQTIIVFEIDGQFWRDPYFADWNNMGRHTHQRGDHHGGMMGYGFGWDHDSLVTTEITGTALVDTTFYMNHYYLDDNNDSEPDYFLNFGPYWYEPESGAVRPLDGETITIVGGLLETSMNLPMVIVYEINDLEWLDSSSIGSHFGGGWFNQNMTGSQIFHSPFDDLDHMIINQGWAGNGGHHGGEMFADSLFCQILEVYPQNIPNDNGMNIIAGYEVNMFNPDGSSAMLSGGMMGGHMSFTSAVNYQLHYTDEQMNYLNGDESTVEAKYWDDDSNNWITISTSLDLQDNTVSFESSEVSNFIILTADQATSVDGDYDQAIVTDFILKQNYPNPFNPTTTIEFDLNEKSYVVISIYNLLGEKLFELNNGILSAGIYKINFDASSLTSGIYFYQLRTGKNIVTKKMDLLK